MLSSVSMLSCAASSIARLHDPLQPAGLHGPRGFESQAISATFLVPDRYNFHGKQQTLRNRLVTAQSYEIV